MKRIILSSLVALMCGAPLAANPTLPHLFAGCAGRFSAELEHAWLTSRTEASRYEAQRQTFITLLEAVQPETDVRRLMSYRIENKMAQASLLTVANFSLNAQRAERARRLARQHLKTCEQLLLGA